MLFNVQLLMVRSDGQNMRSNCFDLLGPQQSVAKLLGQTQIMLMSFDLKDCPKCLSSAKSISSCTIVSPVLLAHGFFAFIQRAETSSTWQAG